MRRDVLQSAPISPRRRRGVCRALRFLRDGVAAFAECSDFSATTSRRLQSTLISSRRRRGVCRALFYPNKAVLIE